MQRFDNLLEKWATNFKPISHNPEGGAAGKRFFRIDGPEQLESILTSIVNIKTPIMGYITQIAGVGIEGKDGLMEYAHRVFIFVYHRIQNNYREDIDIMESKVCGVEIAEKLIAYLRKLKKENPEYRGLRLEDSALLTYPVRFGNWYPIEVTFYQTQNYNKCVNPEDYKEV
jgi:hypothetical protein|nr:MAG TPA: hypothetical protein [Caudoviricetes sp.]